MAVRVAVLNAVRSFGEEQGILLQTSCGHCRLLFLEVEDCIERLVICVKDKTTTIEISIEPMCSPNDGEGFLVNLCVVPLRRRQHSGGECDRALGGVGEDV